MTAFFEDWMPISDGPRVIEVVFPTAPVLFYWLLLQLPFAE
jgi:hypothetical protein